MHLPVFDLPVPALGVEIPVLMHPPVVHFAIVIPVFILILEIINIFMKRRGLTITTFVFFTLLIVIYFAAFATGKTDGSETWDLLTKAGQEDLKAHKLIGIYLMLSTVVVMFAKLFSMAIKKWWMKLIYLLILVGFVAAVLYQGKEGGELVYKYGANNERVQELGEEVFDLKEELEELKEEAASQENTVEEEATAPETSTSGEKKEEQPAAETVKEETPAVNESESKTDEKADEKTTPAQEETKPETSQTTEPAPETSVEEKAKEAINAGKDAAETIAEKAENTTKEAVKTIDGAVQNISDATKGSHDQ